MPTFALPTGKLPHALLDALLRRHGADDPRVILGPGVGRDAAVIAFGDRLLVAKSDPITFATDEIGWYAVHVNANDVACLGATPQWFLATLLLPEGRTDAALVESIYGQVAAACAALGVGLVGGHTEITYGLDRPIVAGTMLGEVAPERLVRPDGARPGDVLIATKGIAIEGTAILAREKADPLGAHFDAAFLQRCAGFLHDPGISVVRDAATALAAGDVHAMHDPTEGGLATGIWELADAAGVHLEVEAVALPILPETQALCAFFGLDPLGLIASGTLLAAVAPRSVRAVSAALEEAGIGVHLIGRVVPGRGATLHDKDGTVRAMPRFDSDELGKALSG